VRLGEGKGNFGLEGGTFGKEVKAQQVEEDQEHQSGKES